MANERTLMISILIAMRVHIYILIPFLRSTPHMLYRDDFDEVLQEVRGPHGETETRTNPHTHADTLMYDNKPQHVRYMVIHLFITLCCI